MLLKILIIKIIKDLQRVTKSLKTKTILKIIFYIIEFINIIFVFKNYNLYKIK